MSELYLNEESYKIIGICMEAHKILGKGHSEKVYGDALEYEFQRNEIPYNRELKIQHRLQRHYFIKLLFC